jgi:hypothetical protein
MEPQIKVGMAVPVKSTAHYNNAHASLSVLGYTALTIILQHAPLAHNIDGVGFG